jgi:large subunit ribosomal protein L13
MKTTIAKEEGVIRAWHLVDAADRPVGRLAAALCDVLRGKNKPDYTPHVDMGDFVVVVNARRVKLTGSKESQKIYKDFSGYPSGLKERPASVIRQRHPDRLIRQAVRGMLPKNHLARAQIRRLKVYPDAEHPHAGQRPQPLPVEV